MSLGWLDGKSIPSKEQVFTMKASRRAAGISCCSTGVQNLIVVATCFFVCFRLGSIDGRELSVNRPITFQILLDRVSSCRLFHRPFPRQLPKKTPITVGKRIVFCNCYKPACKSFKKGGQNLFSYQQWLYFLWQARTVSATQLNYKKCN